MYYLEEMTGQVVTAKTTNGLEMIASLLAYDDENNMITFGQPRVIVVNSEGELALIPYAYTAPTEIMMVHESHVVTVLKTGETSEADYLRIVSDETVIDDEEDTEEEELDDNVNEDAA
jgi:hypothetical protein